MWPFGHGQIQTSSHAGGMTSERTRSSVSASAIDSPVSSSTYEKPRPRRTRRIPGREESERRRRGMWPECPHDRSLKRVDRSNYRFEITWSFHEQFRYAARQKTNLKGG